MFGEAELRVRHRGSGSPLLLLHGHPRTATEDAVTCVRRWSAREGAPPEDRIDAARLGAGGLVYLVVGIVVAANHHYLTSLHTVRQYGSGLFAILLWPLLLLGISLHIH